MPISSRFVVNSTIFLLLVGFLALLAIVGMTIWLGENAQRYVDETSQVRDVRIAAVELRSALQNAESSQRGFLVGGNEIYLAPYGNAKTQAKAQFERLRASLSPSWQTERMIKRLTDLITEKFDEMDRTIALKSRSSRCRCAGFVSQQSRQGADGRGECLSVKHHADIRRSADNRAVPNNAATQPGSAGSRSSAD